VEGPLCPSTRSITIRVAVDPSSRTGWETIDSGGVNASPQALLSTVPTAACPRHALHAGAQRGCRDPMDARVTRIFTEFEGDDLEGTEDWLSTETSELSFTNAAAGLPNDVSRHIVHLT
jgi:hypothetical protein